MYKIVHKNNIVATSIAVLVLLALLFGVKISYAQETIVDGDLIRAENTFDVFIVKIKNGKNFKRLILNPQIFESYGNLRWEDVKDVPQSIVGEYAVSNLIIEVNGDGSVANPKIYRVTSSEGGDVGEKRWLNLIPEQFESLGFDWDSVYFVNHAEASPNFYPVKSELSNEEILNEKKLPEEPEKPVVLSELTKGDIYGISSENPPYFIQASFDLISTNIGEEQTITLKIKNENPIEKVTVTMIRDSFSKEMTLELIEGTTTYGIWQGSWVVAQSTINYNYQASMEAYSGDDTSKVVVTFR